ncbi:MAG TPA: alpha/beta hydrolase [Ferruginibacter sp.]|nr:alpha/beta hydrolase [Ferruginibacter sp.]
MKKVYFIFSLLAFTFFSCKKEAGPVLPSPAGLYDSMIYLKTDIQIQEVAYSTRPNFQNLQYTSENTKQIEITQPTLTPKMDIYLPPNASAIKKQPLLVMIHGGGYSSGDKNAWQNEAYTYSRAGYICASLNYRLTQSGGNQDSLLRLYAVQCALEDIQNAIRFLKKNAGTYFIDTTRIVVFGGSAGGGLSLINAIEFDAALGLNDHPGFSSKTNGSISTGATLINDDPASQLGTLHYDSFDSPVLLFHAKENDSSTGATWSGSAVPTQQAINNSGNSCTLVAQPNLTHTVVLELGGGYWQYVRPFLWDKLTLDEL